MKIIIWTLPLLRLISALKYAPIDESTLAKGGFFEQFLVSDLAESGWITSSAHKIDGSPYNGKWAVNEAYKYPGFEGDKGLVMVSEADYFAISKLLPTPFTAVKQDLVLQFEVKFQEGVSCGGAYLKLLSDLDPKSFSDNSRYEIMFGPDICGSENKVHFLVKKDTSEGSSDSQLRTPPMAKNDQLSALYTLIIRANNDVEIRINGGVAKAGNLLNTKNLMVPPLSVPALIPDMNAKKPQDWDDRRFILDESVEKPADYDEIYNSMWIPNPDVPQPENWNDDESEPLYISDPKAVKPEYWDDEEDGIWKAPIIPNPKCAHGCGKWEPPKIVNPKYKGEWMPPTIENPNFKGEWKHPLIANPEFDEKNDIGIRPINGIGIDVWSMQSGVLFNNIYLGHSVADAERIGNETFNTKLDLEYADYKANRPRAKHQPKAPPKSFDEMIDEESIFVSWVKTPFLAEFTRSKTLWRSFQIDPVTTMLEHPFRFAAYCFMFVFVFTFTFGIANVILFLFLSKREEAKLADNKQAAAAAAAKKEETEEELISQITGKTTGAETRGNGTRKIR